MSKFKNTMIRNRKFIIAKNGTGGEVAQRKDGSFARFSITGILDKGLNIFTHIDAAFEELLLVRLRDAETQYSVYELFYDPSGWYTYVEKIKKAPKRAEVKHYFKRVTNELVDL